MALPSRQHIVKTTYLFVRGYLILLGGYLTIAHIQLPSESANSRKLSFRYVRLSEPAPPSWSGASRTILQSFEFCFVLLY